MKSNNEFQEMKQDVINKVDAFISSYDVFTRHVAPKHWRASGKFFDVKRLKDEIDDFKQCTQKDVDNEFFRKEVLTDSEREEYETEKKYNL